MTELSFAKSFLTALDSRPSKLSPDHVEDPKSYPARNAYILPKQPKPLTRKTASATTGPPSTLSVTLKSLRNPPIDLTLPSQPLSTSILDLKTALSASSSIPISKIKLLHNKKPVPDSKVLKDLIGDGADGKVEFGVMILGGAAALNRAKEEEVLPEEGIVGEGQRVLHTDAFWKDLKGFLVQRLKDEKEGERVCGVFKRAVDAER